MRGMRVWGMLALLALAIMPTGGRGAVAETVEVYPQMGHSGPVTSVAFSPDGRLALTGGGDKVAIIWDVDSGRVIRRLEGHTDTIQNVSFSPNGLFVLTGSLDKTARLWDATTGRQLRQFERHGDPVYTSRDSFTSDGKSVLIGMERGKANIYTVSSGNKIKTFSFPPGDNTSHAVISADSRYILAHGSYSDQPSLYDFKTGRLIRNLPRHIDGIIDMAFSPDSRFIISTNSMATEHAAFLWDVTTGREVRQFVGHSEMITSLAFSPDGRFVATGGEDDVALLWNVATGQKIRRFEGHANSVRSVAFSPDGRFLLTGSEDYTVRLWDILTGQELRRFASQSRAFCGASFSPDGRFALTGGAGAYPRLWDLKTGRQIRRFEGHEKAVCATAYSPDASMVLTGSYDGVSRLWDAATGREIRRFERQPGGIDSVAFSSDGRSALTSGEGNLAKLWNVATGQEIRRFEGSKYGPLKVGFSPDNRFALIGGRDAGLWDIASGKKVISFEGHINSVASVAYSPDGRFILTGGLEIDHTARVWNAAEGREIQRFDTLTEGAASVAFSQDGQTILIGGDKGAVQLWSRATGRKVRQLAGHSRLVFGAAFSPDNRFILTSSLDHTARLWSAATGQEIIRWMVFDGGEWIAITPQGYYAASAAGDKHLNVRVDNDNAKVYGIDQYRAAFHRPDIVEAALRLGDAAQAVNDVQGARERPSLAVEPPFVVVKSPDDGATVGDKAVLRLHVEDRGRAVEQLKIFANGRPVNIALPDGARGLQRAGAGAKRAEFSIDIPVDLDPGVNRIEIAAFNGVAEGRRALTLTSAGKAAALPDLWLLAIGVDAYDDKSIQSLRFAAADARAIAATFKQQEGRLFRKVHTRIVADGGDAQPTRDGLLDNLGFLRQAGQHDFAVLFIAGHGVNDPRGQYHFLPRDAAFEADGAPRRSRAITWRDLRDAVDLPARTLILADTCHSEGVSGRTATRSVNNDRFVKDLQDARAVIFTAARGSELSQERADLGHGVFTHALIAGLTGAAELIKDGKITMKELDAYVSQVVPRLTGGAQHPITDTPDGYSDFPIARP